MPSSDVNMKDYDLEYDDLSLKLESHCNSDINTLLTSKKIRNQNHLQSASL